jgi:glycosyltransferase involved in cell wall biosynthesis
MRIIFDYQTFSIRQAGGISRYFTELAIALGSLEGADVRVIAPLLASTLLARQRDDIRVTGFDLSTVGILPTRVVRGINRVLFPLVAKSAKPDIVHETQYERSNFSFHGAKKIITIHDMIPERFPELFPSLELHRGNIRRAIQRANMIICVSESTRRDLLELYEPCPENVRVVPLASSITPVTTKPEDEREPYFLHVGARYSYKNFLALVTAFGISKLWKTHRLITFSEMTFTIEELEAIDSAQIPRERIRGIGGNDSKLASYYAGATALVVPSLYEGFGIPVVEAMRCGCPVIASNISSLPEVGGDAIRCFDPREPEAIAEMMRRVAEDSTLRENMVFQGRARAARFSWNKCARETYAVYKHALR